MSAVVAPTGGKRCRPGEFSDDNHVRRIEQQLQNARRRQRKRKPKDLRQKRALDHIDLFNGSRHGSSLLILS